MKNQSFFRLIIIFIIALISLVTSGCKPNINNLKSKGDVEKLIESLTYKCEDSGKYYIRNEAAKALIDLVDEEDVDSLLEILQDENYECAHDNSELLLGEIGDAKAVDMLIEKITEDDTFAAAALGKIGDLRAVEPLILSLESKNKYMRRGAVEALGKLGDARAIEPIIDRFVDVDPEVRDLAVEAIIEIGEPSINPLLDMISNEPLAGEKDKLMNETALFALTQMGEPVVEPFINHFGYMVSGFPDSLVNLVRSRYFEISEMISTVTYGNGLLEAAAYFPTNPGSNKMIFLDESLSPHIWNESLSNELAPVSIKDTALVVVLGNVKEEETGILCIYSNGPSKKQYHFEIYVKVYQAQEGTILYEGPLRSKNYCGDISGEPISYEDFRDWWMIQLEAE